MTFAIVGHRGAAAVAPENTLTSFRRAVSDGADVVELDVHATRDGRLAVIHDATVDRTATSGRVRGVVAEMTWAELGGVGLASGEAIPELGEVLEAVAVPIQMEVKAAAATAGAVCAVREAGALDRVTLTSFDPAVLRQARALDRELPLGLIESRATAGALELLTDLDLATYAVGFAGVNAAVVEQAQRQGCVVDLWPASNHDQLRLALDLGVELVTADDPAWCRAALTELAGITGPRGLT